jgi:ABC-type multidrug transport system ATPase subunit
VRAALQQISKRYGRRLVLDRVNLTIGAGEIVGLVGPNGAGKTTLLRVLAGLVNPTGGAVVIDAGADHKSAVLYFGGEHTLPPDISARCWHRLWRVPGTARVTSRRLGVLSRGLRQRVGLEAVLSAASGAVLLLDEPWEGLDLDAGRWLTRQLGALRSSGVATLVASHRLHELAALCDRFELLIGGQMMQMTIAIDSDAALDTRAARVMDAFDRACTASPR